MKKTTFTCITILIIILMSSKIVVFSENRYTIFGIQPGENEILDQVHQKITGGIEISTITIKAFTSIKASLGQNREITKKIDFKYKNMILHQATVKFLGKENIKSAIPFTNLCDGTNYWSDDNEAKKMVKLDSRPRRYTYYFAFENLITQRPFQLKSFIEKETEYQVTTEFNSEAFQYQELITYYIPKETLLISKILCKYSLGAQHRQVDSNIEYSKYLKINNVYVPKVCKVTSSSNGEQYETIEEQIDSIKFNQPIPKEVFTR